MKNRNCIVLLTFLAIPSVAQANAGTPLMWASMLHLLFGNLLIGLLEGVLLAKGFALSKKKCIGLMILANYFSAWLGGLFIAGGISRSLLLGLYNAWPFFWFMVLVTYVITLALEFPFVAMAFRGDPSWLRKTFRGSVLVQTVSYVLLFGWYWLASGTSLYTKTDVVDLSAICLPDKVSMYFISADDGDVYAGALRDSTWRKVCDLNSTNLNDLLLVRPSPQDTNSWDIVARMETTDRQKPIFLTIEDRFTGDVAPSWRTMNTDPPQFEGTSFNFGRVPKLGDAHASHWDFWAGFWPIEGLHGSETNSGKSVSFSLETPFVAWSVRNATHLPGNKVLLQLGKDQICVYDPEKKQIALVTRGRGPIAVGEVRKTKE